MIRELAITESTDGVQMTRSGAAGVCAEHMFGCTLAVPSENWPSWPPAMMESKSSSGRLTRGSGMAEEVEASATVLSSSVSSTASTLQASRQRTISSNKLSQAQ